MGKATAWVFVVAVALATLTGCSPAHHEDSVEYKLASIEAGQSLDPDDARVGEFAQALNSLQNKYNDSRIHIGDVLVTSQTILKEKGVTIGLLELARQLDASVPSNFGTKLNIDGVATAYIVLRTKQ